MAERKATFAGWSQGPPVTPHRNSLGGGGAVAASVGEQKERGRGRRGLPFISGYRAYE